MVCQIVYRTLNFKFHFDMLLLTWLRASENFDYKLKISKKIVYLTFLKVVQYVKSNVFMVYLKAKTEEHNKNSFCLRYG